MLESYDVKWNEDAWGITNKSLTNFRNALVDCWNDRIALFEAGTMQEGEIVGFVVVNKDKKQIIFTGDGFRRDGGGEGGTGYRSVKHLCDLLGIEQSKILQFDIADTMEFDPDYVKREILNCVEKLEGEYFIPKSDCKSSSYVR